MTAIADLAPQFCRFRMTGIEQMVLEISLDSGKL